MGLKIIGTNTITTNVTLTQITDKGTEQKGVLEVQFKRVARDELDQFEMPKLEAGLSAAEYLDADVDWLMKFVVGWGKDVEMPSGSEFNRQTFRELLSLIPSSATAIRDKFFEISSGALTKN